MKPFCMPVKHFRFLQLCRQVLSHNLLYMTHYYLCWGYIVYKILKANFHPSNPGWTRGFLCCILLSMQKIILLLGSQGIDFSFLLVELNPCHFAFWSHLANWLFAERCYFWQLTQAFSRTFWIFIMFANFFVPRRQIKLSFATHVQSNKITPSTHGHLLICKNNKCIILWILINLLFHVSNQKIWKYIGPFSFEIISRTWVLQSQDRINSNEMLFEKELQQDNAFFSIV